MARAQAVLRDARDVLAVDQDASALDVVEALQQRQQGRLAAARRTDQPDALAGRDAQAEILEHAAAARIGERDVLEDDALAPRHQRHGLGMVAQVVRLQQGGDRLGQPRHVLRDVDQRHREIARGMQHREAQRADQHDVAGAGPPRCHSTIAQASTATVSTMVSAACSRRSLSR